MVRHRIVDNTEQLRQQRIVWDGGDRLIQKVIFGENQKTAQHHYRVDFFTEDDKGKQRFIASEVLTEEEGRVVESYLNLIQQMDKEIALYVAGARKRAAERVAAEQRKRTKAG